MKNWFNRFIVWLFPSDDVEYIGLTDKEASGFVNVTGMDSPANQAHTHDKETT